jgi:hypothetical protein
MEMQIYQDCNYEFIWSALLTASWHPAHNCRFIPPLLILVPSTAIARIMIFLFSISTSTSILIVT